MIPLEHSCPESGFSCPDCGEVEKLKYRIRQDEYVCGACGVVSTVYEVVAHSRELRHKEREKENHAFDWIDDYTLPDTRQGAD